VLRPETAQSKADLRRGLKNASRSFAPWRAKARRFRLKVSFAERSNCQLAGNQK
jgi:hypothetical protein